MGLPQNCGPIRSQITNFVSLNLNLTIKNCDKVEKFKKFKTILVKSLKLRQRFDVRLTSLSSQKMSKMRKNINVQEFLRDTNKKVKICSDNDKIFARSVT